MPAYGTLASSAAEGGFEEARAAHLLTAPAAAAAATSSGGLEEVSVAGCGHHRGVSESSVQVQDTLLPRAMNVGWQCIRWCCLHYCAPG